MSGPSKAKRQVVCPGCKRTVGISLDRLVRDHTVSNKYVTYKLSRHSARNSGGPLCPSSRLSVEWKEPEAA